MSDIWFISDTHWGHSYILEHRTKFQTIEEHDETLVENWNKVVKPGDRVYHLGDVALGNREKARKILDRLNGQIFLIRGNHDHHADHKDCRDRFVWIKDYAKLKIGDQKVYLFHYPILSWNCIHYGSFHLHGHQHRVRPAADDCRRLDVGVDGHDFRPWAWEDVDQLLRTKPYPADHHD